MPHLTDGETEAQDQREILVSGRPSFRHPSPCQFAALLPEAVCVPVSIQGLEVLAIIDPLAAARTHGQLASAGGKGVRNHTQEGNVGCRPGLPLAGPHVHLHKAPCTHAAPGLSSVRTEQETE